MAKHEIDADFNTLYMQGQDVADELMRRAIDSIDEKLGDGYAKKHPELTAAFMNVASQNFSVSSALAVFQALVEKITDCAQMIR